MRPDTGEYGRDRQERLQGVRQRFPRHAHYEGLNLTSVAQDWPSHARLAQSLSLSLYFQSQTRTVKCQMTLVEDIPTYDDVTNLGSDDFDAVYEHIMQSEIDPVSARRDGEIHPVCQCDLAILEQ